LILSYQNESENKKNIFLKINFNQSLFGLHFQMEANDVLNIRVVRNTTVLLLKIMVVPKTMFLLI
jgi:hypothetical protein